MATSAQPSGEPGDGFARDCPVAREILAAEPDLERAYDLLAERAPDELAWLVKHLPEAILANVPY